MKTRTAFLAATLILVSSLYARAQSAPESWQRYTVAAQQFSVALPTLPAMTTTMRYFFPSGKKRQEIQLGAYAGGLVYQVNVCENGELRKSLHDFMAEQTVHWKANLASAHDIELGGIPGKELLFPARRGPEASRFFATESRLYHFSVGGATTNDDPRVKYFLASIVLGKRQDGIVVTDGPGSPYEQDTGEAPLSGKDVDQKIVLAQKPEPVYTEAARQNEVTGTVILKAVFTSAGNVSDIRVVSGLPFGLTEIAVAAARKIKFYPALKDGKRVSTLLQLEYNFDLY